MVNNDYNNKQINSDLPIMLKIVSTAFALTCLMLTSTAAQADVYSWKDSDGSTVYSDQKTSSKAQSTPSGNTINYYSPPPSKPKPGTTLDEPLATLSIAEDEPAAKPALSEQQCQQQYKLDCDQVTNWRKYALERCGDDPRCEDPEFLDKKYRPRSMEEMQAIARRSSVRNNLQDKKIAQFLTRKYSNYCENQAELYCRSQRSASCDAQMRSYCNDPRGLDDIFARYDNLTPIEKQRIISQAKQLAMENGDNQLNYEQIVAALIDILIQQALLGI
ncbi:DUF4124 domain-containing protein [Oceanicoccus sagamiensis]|uniref:DUF4124 domain-containing protein n=1 Tax=Oceanicoccus sagamiensis TaxID=716816 RepID=A0A1X9NEA3_9GAMM|nr:DUF4124 domain-containing protein [Oceanicoccus sagamiensis]ARN74762.1 hypothetical protein BST96_11920 [Oceanicoccus sagamiensis]